MVLAALIHGLAAYTAPVPRARGASGLAMMAKSESLPFLDAPPALDGSMVGDKGFDPLGFTSRFPQAITWFREAELKHGRLAMLATAGWLAVDMGIKFPGAKYAGLTAFAAHDAMVASGNMGFLLTVVGICEVFAGLALYEQAEGSGRPAGDYFFDPLEMADSPERRADLELKEIKNGRLAMLAFSGIVTQSALYDVGPPYF